MERKKLSKTYLTKEFILKEVKGLLEDYGKKREDQSREKT